MDELLTARQLQDLLRVDRTTIYRMLKDGRLTGIKVGGQWRFLRQQVDTLLAGSHPALKEPQSLSTDVLPIHCVQAIQNVFAEIAGIGSVAVGLNGEPLTHTSNPCRFCRLILESESGRQACVASWRKLAEQPDRRPQFLTCHAGLQYARAQIEVNGEFIAMLVAGQFYATPPNATEEATRLDALAETYDLSLAELVSAAHDLPVLDNFKRERLSDWLQDVARTFADIGRERAELMSRLRRIVAMSTLPSS